MKLLPLGELHTYSYFNHYYFCLFIVEDRKILESLNDTIVMMLSGDMSSKIGQVPSILTFNDLINGKFVTFLSYNIYQNNNEMVAFSRKCLYNSILVKHLTIVNVYLAFQYSICNFYSSKESTDRVMSACSLQP